MRPSKEDLELVNPRCDYYPAGTNEASLQKLRADIIEFGRELTQEFGAQFHYFLHEWNQDATYAEDICLPDHLITGDSEIPPSIRVSNHRRLYVITVLRRISPETEARIERVAENVGFAYTPEGLFGEPFETRERHNGDLFTQLYDYV